MGINVEGGGVFLRKSKVSTELYCPECIPEIEDNVSSLDIFQYNLKASHETGIPMETFSNICSYI